MSTYEVLTHTLIVFFGKCMFICLTFVFTEVTIMNKSDIRNLLHLLLGTIPLTCSLWLYFSCDCSITYSRELSRTTTSLGGSFRSDKESIGRVCAEETENAGKKRHVSAARLYSMVGPDWFYGVAGTLCAFIAGAQMPLFALGISHALVSYYMDWETTCHEVKKIAFLFCGAAVITVTVHAIEHLSFGIMGERLTLRVREMMFSGNFDQLIITFSITYSIFLLWNISFQASYNLTQINFTLHVNVCEKIALFCKWMCMLCYIF